MKEIAIIIALVWITLPGYSQKANNLIGLRGGFGTGVTFQHYLDESKAVELIAHSRWRGFNLTGLYEVHKPFLDVDGMNWYYGAGAHIGFYTYYADGPRWQDDSWEGTRMIIGADAILGLEYFFDEIPFQISADWKPAINLVGFSGFWGDEGAFAIRYIF